MQNIPLAKIAASAALFKDGKILLIKRAANCKNFPGAWTFPSGGIEELDASHEEAVIREVREETGLKFLPKRKFNFYESIVDGRRFFSLVHLGEWSGEVKLKEDEGSEWGFFDYQTAKGLELAFAYEQVIKDLYKEGILK